MKDYRLSEIRDICKQLHAEYGECACDECYIETMCWKVCDESVPKDWDDIEPRDMIELPCKVVGGNYKFKRIQVIWRGAGWLIKIAGFENEKEAEEFLTALKQKVRKLSPY